MPEIPEKLQAAIASGEITKAQLRELIRLEADFLGLRYGEAVRLARKRDLPESLVADDLEMLVAMLPA